MKIYLDSEDSFYSTNQEAVNAKAIKENKSNERIGIISIILIVAYAVWLISGWII